MRGDQVFLDDPPLDQMLGDDSIENRRIAGAVPGSFGIDDRNRTAFADPQAVGLGPEDASLLRKTQRLEPRLQMIPGLQPSFLVAALRRGLVTAQKDVPAC